MPLPICGRTGRRLLLRVRVARASLYVRQHAYALLLHNKDLREPVENRYRSMASTINR
ncbi:uncharacterized protein CANTADRAFT_95626, partial [Suhomyces tanzawaensis NRRL Y-17324]